MKNFIVILTAMILLTSCSRKTAKVFLPSTGKTIVLQDNDLKFYKVNDSIQLYQNGVYNDWTVETSNPSWQDGVQAESGYGKDSSFYYYIIERRVGIIKSFIQN